jgi:uncharacterized protein (TIGR02266 family)
MPASGIHVAVTIDQGSDHNLWSDVTMDMSKGGVFVATFHPLSLGTEVHLLITLAAERVEIAARGVVRWTRVHREGSDGGAGVGVRFLDLDPEDIEKLARFVENVRDPMIFELDDPPMRKAR